jgi:hypothetical protein
VKDIHAEGILPDETGEDQDEDDEGHGTSIFGCIVVFRSDVELTGISIIHQDDDEPELMSDEDE